MLLAGSLAYGTSWFNPFLFDDKVDDASIRQWWQLERVLSPPRESAFAGRPIANLSIALNYAIGGLAVPGYHLVNLGLHLACALLLAAIVWRALAGPRLRDRFGAQAEMIAFATALIWALHPLNSEVVDYVTQRTESLMALFYFATLYACLRAFGSARVWWSVLAVMACALGMASKESMVTAPVAVMLYDGVLLYPSWAAAWRARWRLYASLLATWSVLIALQRSGPRMNSAGFSAGVSVWTYLLNQGPLVLHYLRLVVWPRSLVVTYGEPRDVTLSAVLLPVLVVLALVIVSLIAVTRRRPAGLLGAWTFLTLAPTSSVVPIATEVGAERRMYLPLAGLVVLAVATAVWVWPRMVRGWFRLFPTAVPSGGAVSAALIAGLAIVLGLGTSARTREYASPLRLAATTLERWPSGEGHYSYGWELTVAGRHADAIREYRLAAPTFPRARYYLASELYDAGSLDDAILEFRRFIDERPLLLEAIQAHLKIGRALERQGHHAEALAEFQRVLSMQPSNLETRKGIADALVGEGHVEESLPAYRQYLAARPDDLEALTDYGIALARTETHDQEALAVFRHAMDLNPRDAAIRFNFARTLLLNDRVAEAIAEMQVALALKPEDVGGRDLLGYAFALEGHYDDAMTQYERALQIDPADGQARDALLRIRAQIGRVHSHAQ